MPTPNKPEKQTAESYLNLSAATEKLVTTGSIGLSSSEDAQSERQNRDKDRELEREQKRISFWVKDISTQAE